VLSVGESVFLTDRNSVHNFVVNTLVFSVNHSPFRAFLDGVVGVVGDTFVFLDRGVLDNSSLDASSSNNFVSVFNLG
jgi:hypothetical protein